MSINLDDIAQSRARIVDAAQRMLDGQCSYIEGARLICSLLDQARIDRLGQPFIVFIGISCETDDVPVGQLKEQWHPEAVSRLESKWADAERYAKNHGEPACRAIIKWIAEHPSVIP